MDKIKIPKQLQEDFLKAIEFKKYAFEYQVKKFPNRVEVLKRGFLRFQKLDSCSSCQYSETCKLKELIEIHSISTDAGCNDWKQKSK